MNFEPLEVALTKLAALAVFVEVIQMVALGAALYFTIRAAVRDGIRDTRTTDRWKKAVSAARREKSGDTKPPMYAE